MKGERGVTLVELLAAVAVTGIIVVFLGTAIYQILTVTEYGNSRLTAMHELQNTAFWFNFDGQQARLATGGSQLALTMTDNSSVTYSLAGTQLNRDTSGSRMVLARNISFIDFSIAGRVVTMSVISSPEGRDNVSENGTYSVNLRPSEEEL
jgi:prepilin-type N-terminal cleavage/methylation domain-containing protein